MSDDSLGIAKQVVELAKELAGALTPESEKAQETGSRASRGGPLLVVGRLYVALTTIAALAATAAAFIDKNGGTPSNSVSALRYLVGAAVLGGLLGGGYLVYHLAKRHPSFLFSPTEFANEVHAQMMGQGVSDEEAGKALPPKTNNSTAAALPPLKPLKKQSKERSANQRQSEAS